LANTPKAMPKRERFIDHEFTEAEARMIESAIMNGMTPEEMWRTFYNVGGQTVAQALTRQSWLKKRVKTAVENAKNKATDGMRRLGEGVTVCEREYVVPLQKGISEDALREHKERLMYCLKDGNFDDFWTILLRLVTTKEEFLVKIREKELPPDYRANELILRAYAGDTWDIEARNKKIPNTKIIVTLQGDDAKKVLGGKKKELKADYVVET